jgi:hypothetical protein
MLGAFFCVCAGLFGAELQILSMAFGMAFRRSHVCLKSDSRARRAKITRDDIPSGSKNCSMGYNLEKLRNPVRKLAHIVRVGCSY